MLKIGFDAKRAAQNRTGLGNYSRFVLRILSEGFPQHEYHLYIPKEKRMPYLREIPTWRSLILHFPRSKGWRRLSSIWRIGPVTKDVRHDGIQLFHGLSNELPLSIRRAHCKSIVTIHDLIFIHYPQYYHAIDRWIYNYKFRKACRIADRVIAVSEYTKREIMHYYGTPEEKIRVVYQGCDQAFRRTIPSETLQRVRQHYQLPERYMLYVGSIEERKNVMLAVKALREIRSQGGIDGCQPPLIIVGRRTDYTAAVERYVQAEGMAEQVRFFHKVPYEDLPSIYRLAHLFVYPSRIEGFGIPVLEALNSAVPVIACTGSCLEEAGGPHSVYVHPDDVQAMVQSIRRIWTDAHLRQVMIREGMRYADEHFSEDKLRNDLMQVYQEVLEVRAVNERL